MANSSDYFALHYKIQKNDKKLSSEMKKNIRPFLSKIGLIREVKKSSTLIIIDYGKNLSKIHQLISNFEKNYK